MYTFRGIRGSSCDYREVWLIIDPATGAIWALDTHEINATLEASKQGAIIEPNKAGVVLLQDVSLSLRDKMVKVSQ
ncbi:MAG: hypothetical protein HY752_00935 [Nitrospirae bacterium]|nr:hypothetical protein [Nitrospirota bacterium]